MKIPISIQGGLVQKVGMAGGFYDYERSLENDWGKSGEIDLDRHLLMILDRFTLSGVSSPEVIWIFC